MSMLTLDGSYGEGGGQILRTALALSMLTKKPFRIIGIRSGRKNAGLKSQHLCAIRALEALSNAKSENLYVGSNWISFFPSEINRKEVSIDVGTAGSITLLLQALVLPAIFAKGKVKLSIKGGTDVAWSTPADYFSKVFLPNLRRYADFDFRILRRGYYPKGNGSVEITINPKIDISNSNTFEQIWKRTKSFGRIELSERGKLIMIGGISHSSADLRGARVAERQADAAAGALKKLDCPVNIQIEYCDAESTGSGICLYALFSRGKGAKGGVNHAAEADAESAEADAESAEADAESAESESDAESRIILGADSLGERHKPAENVGLEAANSLIDEINSEACVDAHLADQLVPFLSIFGGEMRTSRITQHASTNIYVVEQFLGKIFGLDEQNRIIKTLF